MKGLFYRTGEKTMKKGLLTVILVLTMAVGFVGCGDRENTKDKDVVLQEQQNVNKSRVNLRDLDTEKIVTMAQYKGLKPEVGTATTDEEGTVDAINAQNAVVASYVNNCKYDNIPTDLIAQYREILVHDISQAASAQGMDPNAYIEMIYETDAETFLNDYALEVSKEFLAMQAIANKENLNVSDEELQSILEQRTMDSGAASVEEFLGETDREAFREFVMTDKVIAFIMENAEK